MVWYFHFFKNFPQFVVTTPSKASEADLKKKKKFPCFFYDPGDVGNLISGSSAFSKPSLYIWKFLGHVPLKPSSKNFYVLACSCTFWSFLCLPWKDILMF